MVLCLFAFQLHYSTRKCQIWETPFDSLNETFPCSVDRISGPLGPTDHMNLLNHFLDLEVYTLLVPDEFHANSTNSLRSILANANACIPLNGGRNPNFILLDWFDIGNASGAAALLNAGITNAGYISYSISLCMTGVLIFIQFFFLETS